MRQKLPDRRLAVTRQMGDEYHVSFGLDPRNGALGEVFIKGSKIGSDMEMLLDDASVVLSLALQYGVPVDQLIHSLDTGREDGAKSIIARAIAEMENVKKEIAGSDGVGQPVVPPTKGAP